MNKTIINIKKFRIILIIQVSNYANMVLYENL